MRRYHKKQLLLLYWLWSNSLILYIFLGRIFPELASLYPALYTYIGFSYPTCITQRNVTIFLFICISNMERKFFSLFFYDYTLSCIHYTLQRKKQKTKTKKTEANEMFDGFVVHIFKKFISSRFLSKMLSCHSYRTRFKFFVCERLKLHFT